MASRPRTVAPQFHYKFWKIEGKHLYFCDRADLEGAIRESGVPEHLIHSRMGAGYHYIADALNGVRLDRWAISHIETGISPVREDERRNVLSTPPEPTWKS